MKIIMAATSLLAFLFGLIIQSDLYVLMGQIGGKQHIFTQAAVGRGITTTMFLHNPNSTTITLDWKMYAAPSGSGFSVFKMDSLNLFAGASTKVELSSSDESIVVGWLKIESAKNFIATEILDLNAAGGDTVGFLPATLSKESRFLGEVSSDLLTGLAIVNPSSVATSKVTVILLDNSGGQSYITSFSLGPQSHLARYLNEYPLFSGLSQFEGTVKVISTLPFYSVALVQKDQEFIAVSVETETTVTTPQLGLNFIRFFWGSEEMFQPASILEDFGTLGVHACRQLIKADVFWNVVENTDNQWDFGGIDQIFTPGIEPILTLFALQYASPTPPWASDPAEFQKTVGTEARDYVETVVKRFSNKVTYWEIGNEMDHWRAADSGGDRGNLPSYAPLDGFTPQQQGLFLSQVAEIIRQNDPEAVILLPGMGGIDDYTLNTWLYGVIEGGGSEWFDVVNYHFYGDWRKYASSRTKLQTFLEDNSLQEKPIWLTETGVTSSPTLTLRTNYPNSQESQAADIFRRTVQAWGHGDQFVAWHTYISSGDIPTNDWRLYGLRRANNKKQLSYYALELLAAELLPFNRVEKLSGDAGDAAKAYKVNTSKGFERYVLWGNGSYTVPTGITECVSVIPDSSGNFLWSSVFSGEAIVLEEVPVLCR